jgi:hypothetical protein
VQNRRIGDKVRFHGAASGDAATSVGEHRVPGPASAQSLLASFADVGAGAGENVSARRQEQRLPLRVTSAR